MGTTHSWKWLAPRFNGRSNRKSDAKAIPAIPIRPCLKVEPLDERVLLSAEVASVIVDPSPDSVPDGGTVVLGGLLKSGFEISEDQFALLKALSSDPDPAAKTTLKDISFVQVINKSSPLLFQLDDELVKIGENAIKGELTEKKVQESTKKLDYLVIKLEEVIITSVDAETQNKVAPILESLKANVESFVQGMLSVQGDGTEPHASTLDFLKLSASFLKIDDLLLKAELDFLKSASPGVDVLDYKSKIEDIFLKTTEAIVKLDESVAKVLLPAVQTYQADVLGLLGSLSDGRGDDEGDGGGIILPELTDDIIV